MKSWIVGVVATVVCLVGLLVASGAGSGTAYYVGLAIAALAIVYIFALIGRATRQPPRTEPTDPHWP